MGWLTDRMMRKAREANMRVEQEQDARKESRAMQLSLREYSPTITVFRISNGYLVQTYENPNHTPAGVGFTYCKDHQEISDLIVTTEMRKKLGVENINTSNTGRKLQPQTPKQWTQPDLFHTADYPPA